MGTGIYRGFMASYIFVLSVPCGYRDIPARRLELHKTTRRSLWVQGYTAKYDIVLVFSLAFPVGTGIYRFKLLSNRPKLCVPCGYRDIPFIDKIKNNDKKRSLWVQGYTDFWDLIKSLWNAFPVGTGIYRQIRTRR